MENWSRLVKYSFLVILFIIKSYALDQDAKGVYNNIKNFYGSKNNINENINKPLTGNSQFKTLDNSKTFSASMQCPSAEKAIIINFSQSRGDFIANVSVDTDLNGTFDYYYTTPNISGVCTNGIVSCIPGTWQNCKYYYWEAPNKKPRLIQTQDTSKTGTCSCANISCGITQLDQPLLSLIGGGVSQAIMKLDSNFLVSKSKWNGNSLEMYGQSPKNCNKPNFNSYGSTNPENYYKYQTPPSTSIIDVSIQQRQDPYSPYSVIEPMQQLEYEQGKSIGMPGYRECEIKNVVFINGILYYTDGNCLIGSSPNCLGTLESLGGNKFRCHVSGKNNGCGQTYNLNLCGNWFFRWSIPDDRRVYIKINNTVIRNEWYKDKGWSGGSGLCTGDTTRGTSNCGNYTSSSNFVSAYFDVGNNGACNGVPSSELYYDLYKTEVLDVAKQNTCPVGCTLVDEWVCDKDGNNCIQTVKEGNSLNIILKKQCYKYTTSLSEYMICTDGSNITALDRYSGTKIIGSGWFYIKRKYNCGQQELDVDLSRTKQIVQNSSLNNQTISYTDVDGSTNSSSFNVDTNTCLNPICTVEITKQDTSVFSDNTDRSKLGTSKKELEIRTCIDNGNGFTCPLDDGATLVENCKCNIKNMRAGFEKAITSMEILNQAIKDTICSSSNP